MRLVSFGEPGQECAGIVCDDRVVALAACGFPGSVRDLLAGDQLSAIAAATIDPAAGVALDTVRLGPPVPDAGKIICVGLNYKAHADEQDLAWPTEPLLFAKATTAMVGCADAIELPADDPDSIDYEVELVAVVGQRARHVALEDAMQYVAGYMVANDVSARRWQKGDGQWFRAKSCDTFFPCGPALVTTDEVGDYRALRLTTDIGDEHLQDATADDLIHDLPHLIAYLSRYMTLEPGDLISTGTPSGVGCYREPRRFLRVGDTVRCAVTGLGAVVNPVIAGRA
ncbi:MAG: fumarylacetoacetate hydrolase family protein [Planctomycetota bacterium]|jgi:2-keto-4-pentenoate hydratase/2-oxohepta-3-ene-1,7-dioic acid hydratase in catechol pathway|nr:fumarylacetoacetate hydrolase family protein [Planctomycetota bacterium]